MTRHLITYAAFLIMGLEVIMRTEGEKKLRNTYIYACMSILFALAALRNEVVGGDVERYISSFENYAKMSYETMLNYLSKNGIKDPFYYYTGWIFSRVTQNVQYWLAAIALLSCGAYMWLIRKKSPIPILSLMVFLCLGFYAFSLTGLRQTVAMAITIFSYKFIEERKLIPFLIMIFIAQLFHASAIAFLIAYPLANVKMGWKHGLFFIICLLGFVAFKSQIVSILSRFLTEERYENYLNGEAKEYTFSGFAIQIVIFLYCMIYYKKAIEADSKNIILYNLVFLGVAFQLYSSMVAEIFRISMYFSLYSIALVPIATAQEENVKLKEYLIWGITVVLFIYMVRDGVMDYKFFWQ